MKITKIDDINRLLNDPEIFSSVETIRNTLALAIIYIRTLPLLSGSRTESIAEIEESMESFLEHYDGSSFEEVYSFLREIASHIPRFSLFDIDITDLREIAHDFDALYREESVFSSFAADVRRLVHQHLSDKVIDNLDDFEEFLKSDSPNTIIDGSSIIGASREEKDELLESDIFLQLRELRDKLEKAWIGAGSNFRKEYGDILPQVMKNINLEEIECLVSYKNFKSDFDTFLMNLLDLNWEAINIGLTRYYLKKLMEETVYEKIPGKGGSLMALMTVDVLLEQVAFIHYSNRVNSELSLITDDNFMEALKVVFNLALCTRSVGHGTKHLGRFAFLIQRLFREIEERPDRVAHFPSILDAMNAELENNFFFLRDVYSSNLSESGNTATVTRILNNVVREKTTHLLGNMINNIKTYIDRKEFKGFGAVLNGLNYTVDIPLNKLTFRYGAGMPVDIRSTSHSYFMGGKGSSQVRNSKIVMAKGLEDVHVPPGHGFSTLTWYALDKTKRMKEFKDVLREMIHSLEDVTEKRFGSSENPLFVMARSGAIVSMPGIMETVSHIGINTVIASQWAEKLQEPWRAYQALISFLLSYARAVLDLPTADIIHEAGFLNYESLYSRPLEEVAQGAERIQQVIEKQSRSVIPQDPLEQLVNSAISVFKSYEQETVQLQAREMHIPEMFQTACLVQECLPILSSKDCSGVFFTRNPATGRIGSDKNEEIEFREGFFGNVIADGMVAPLSINHFMRMHPSHYKILKIFKYYDEREQRFPTDIEFAIRQDKLYIVQSRVLKQSPIAMVANSYDFYTEKIYSEFKLIKRTAFSVNRPVIENYLDRKIAQSKPVIARGKSVNGGAVRGRVIKDHKSIGKFEGPLIFLTESNVPPGVILKEKRFAGYLSREGGITSHAALVAIGERKPCLTDVQWESGEEPGTILLGGVMLNEGDEITIDANTDSIYLDEIPIIAYGLVNDELERIREKIIAVIDQLISR